ncbi:MAG: siderophore-interacting protein [Candidatus Dormibacteria bacterium]
MSSDSQLRLEPLPVPRTYDLEVVSVEDWTATLRRIVLRAPELRDLDYRVGQDLMLKLDSGRGLVNRRYTIRRVDLPRGEVEIDVVRHGSGPGARWADATRPGERLLDVVAPRGKITVDPGAAWHLFIGDETAIPAMFHMAESLPDPRTVRVLLEVGDALDAPPPPPGLAGTVHFVNRSGGPPGADGPLLAAAADADLPASRGRAYIAGEARTVLAVRDLLQRRGLTRDQMAVKAYWRRDQPNLDRGEPDPAE